MAAGEGTRDLRFDEIGVEGQGIDADVLHPGVAGDGLGDHVLVDRGAAARLLRAEAEALDQLVGHRLLRVGARRAQVPRHHAHLFLHLLGLVLGEHALAQQDLGEHLGGQVHGVALTLSPRL